MNKNAARDGIRVMNFQKRVLILPLLLMVGCSNGLDEPVEVSEILLSNNARPLTDVIYEVTDDRVERGKYLTHSVLWCFNCHTERDTTLPGHPIIDSKLGSGRSYTITDSTWFYSSNITQHKRTGIGNYTDDMIARTIREGVGPDGRSVKAMPWYSFRYMSDEDLASVIVYLKTLTPIEKEIPKRNIGAEEEKFLQNDGLPLLKSLDPPDFTDPVDRGRYLIDIANCSGCHTGWYERNPGVFGGGNPMSYESDIFSTNITSHSTGIGSWSEETFINVMKTGKNGTLDRLMPWTAFRNMSDEDLGAIYQALKTTKPVDHIVLNRIPFSFCEVCGLEHGGGSLNKISGTEFKKISIPDDLSGAYVHELIQTDTVFIYYEDEKLMSISIDGEHELLPISETHFSFEGLYAPIRFHRTGNEKVTSLSYWDLGRAKYYRVEE